MGKGRSDYARTTKKIEEDDDAIATQRLATDNCYGSSESDSFSAFLRLAKSNVKQAIASDRYTFSLRIKHYKIGKIARCGAGRTRPVPAIRLIDANG